MATLIKIKRKLSAGNDGIRLSKGEPFYNLSDKHFYIGNKDEDTLDGKKHIAEVTKVDGDALVFQIGEDPKNVIDLSELSGIDAKQKWKTF